MASRVLKGALVCSGSTPGSPTSWTCPENLQKEAPRRIRSDLLAPFGVKEQRRSSELPPDDQSADMKPVNAERNSPLSLGAGEQLHIRCPRTFPMNPAHLWLVPQSPRQYIYQPLFPSQGPDGQCCACALQPLKPAPSSACLNLLPVPFPFTCGFSLTSVQPVWMCQQLRVTSEKSCRKGRDSCCSTVSNEMPQMTAKWGPASSDSSLFICPAAASLLWFPLSSQSVVSREKAAERYLLSCRQQTDAVRVQLLNIAEHLAAKEPDVSLRRPNTELTERRPD
ncbi:uncharacterized protein LOC122865990 [Siniperca chuatsi]|uniref:uncharacterized protein LOC122865990 n=1 Tax=Siniperca chuatsi TaxID=119488 RepID=UPI001CE1B404|nr:uncharacterized protein LOC122865990 [Siniperca chuatsi]